MNYTCYDPVEDAYMIMYESTEAMNNILRDVLVESEFTGSKVGSPIYNEKKGFFSRLKDIFLKLLRSIKDAFMSWINKIRENWISDKAIVGKYMRKMMLGYNGIKADKDIVLEGYRYRADLFNIYAKPDDDINRCDIALALNNDNLLNDNWQRIFDLKDYDELQVVENRIRGKLLQKASVDRSIFSEECLRYFRGGYIDKKPLIVKPNPTDIANVLKADPKQLGNSQFKLIENTINAQIRKLDSLSNNLTGLTSVAEARAKKIISSMSNERKNILNIYNIYFTNWLKAVSGYKSQMRRIALRYISESSKYEKLYFNLDFK